MSEFDEYADDYEDALNRGIAVSGESKEFFAEQRVAWTRRCLAALDLHPRHVLDYGCGTGTATPFLARALRPASILGLDTSPASLRVARESARKAPATYLSPAEYTPNGSIDLIYCNGVFHHIPRAERATAACYLAQCLAPGGVLALWENNPWSPAARLVMRRIPFDRDAVMVWPSEARALFRSTGFEVLRTDFLFVFPRALGGLRAIEPLLSRFPVGAQYQVLLRRATRASP